VQEISKKKRGGKERGILPLAKGKRDDSDRSLGSLTRTRSWREKKCVRVRKEGRGDGAGGGRGDDFMCGESRLRDDRGWNAPS